MKNIQNLISYEKGYIDFCRQTLPFPRKGHMPPQMVFRSIFQKNLLVKYPVPNSWLKKVILIFSVKRPLSLKIIKCAPRTVFIHF